MVKLWRRAAAHVLCTRRARGYFFETRFNNRGGRRDFWNVEVVVLNLVSPPSRSINFSRPIMGAWGLVVPCGQCILVRSRAVHTANWPSHAMGPAGPTHHLRQTTYLLKTSLPPHTWAKICNPSYSNIHRGPCVAVLFCVLQTLLFYLHKNPS